MRDPIDIQKEIAAIIARLDHWIEEWPEPLKSMSQAFAEKGYPYRTAFINNKIGFPGLYLPFWITLRYQNPIASQNLMSLRASVYAALLGYLYIRIQDDIYDEKEGTDRSWLLVANEFIRESFGIYHQLFPANSEFWHYFQQAWHDFSQATAWEIKTCRGKMHVLQEKDLLQVGQKLAFAKVPIAAIVLLLGQEQDLPQLFKIVDLLAVSSQLINDFFSMEGDLKTQHFTYPLTTTLAEKENPPLSQPFSLFAKLLEKNSIEGLLDYIINLDEEILFLLREDSLEWLENFLAHRITLVKEWRHLYMELKFKALLNLDFTPAGETA